MVLILAVKDVVVKVRKRFGMIQAMMKLKILQRRISLRRLKEQKLLKHVSEYLAH